jgi:hypothetical protein
MYQSNTILKLYIQEHTKLVNQWLNKSMPTTLFAILLEEAPEAFKLNKKNYIKLVVNLKREFMISFSITAEDVDRIHEEALADMFSGAEMNGNLTARSILNTVKFMRNKTSLHNPNLKAVPPKERRREVIALVASKTASLECQASNDSGVVTTKIS